MTLLYSDPRFLNHLTGEHPESPARLVEIANTLEESPFPESVTRAACIAATPEEIKRCHEASQYDHVVQLAEQGGGRIDSDTVVSPDSARVAMLAAGTAIDAVRRVTTGEASNALCLIRPPGHHAVRNRSMGFCLFNSIAVAAQAALAEELAERILIVDWDVHHGNGTQDIFYDNEQVFFLSLHRHPFYPGTGLANETGTGAGLGATRNVPLPFGTPRSDYLRAFQATLADAVDRCRPQLILLSAGFDAHFEDPVGSLGLETEDFGTLTDAILDAAEDACEGRIVSLLEGGYNVQRLAECVAVHLHHLAERSKTPDA